MDREDREDRKDQNKKELNLKELEKLTENLTNNSPANKGDSSKDKMKNKVRKKVDKEESPYEIYKRKKGKVNMKDKVQFQVISWEKFDKEVEGNEFDLEFKIFMFGVMDNGKSICVEINDFTPYFYAKIPDELQKNWNDYKTKEVERYIKTKLYKFKDSLLKVSIANKKDLNGFTNDENYKFLKIIVKNEKVFTKVKYILCPGSYRPKPNIPSVSSRDLNFTLYEANIEPLIRFCHIKNIKLCGWVELKKYAAEDNSRCQLDLSCRWTDIEPLERKDVAKIHILSYDIEAISERARQSQKNIFPDSELETDIISQIGNTLYIYGTDTNYEIIFTINSSEDGYVEEIEGVVICTYDTEKELLRAWINFIRDIDPDIITGYNINNFDWNYIYNRCKLLELELDLMRITRLHDKPGKFVIERLESKAAGENIFKYFQSPGIFNSDLYTIIKREKKLVSYKLEDVANEFIGDHKDPLTPLDIFNWGKGTAKEISTVCKYCVKDCTLVINLIKKLCIITNNTAMSNVTWVPINYLESRGQQIKVHSQLLYEARLNDYLVPTLPYKSLEELEGEDKFTGATVQEAIPGAHFEPIAGLDFASLYPSIMIANNYSYETIVKDPKYDNLEGVEYKDIVWKEDEGTELEREERVRFVQNKMGILPIMLEKLWKERKSIKKEMKGVKAQLKEAKTEEEKKDLNMQYDVLDGFQLAMKVSMNSIYGFTGANLGRLPEKRIAAATTAEGRRMIQACKEYVENNYDAKVVYGDSVPGYTPIYIMINNKIEIIEIENLGNYIKNKKWKIMDFSANDSTYEKDSTKNFAYAKYYLNLEDLNILTWTDTGFTKIKRIMRHKISEKKKILRIFTRNGIVDVTDDHSLILENGKTISPKKLKTGNKLLMRGLIDNNNNTRAEEYINLKYKTQIQCARKYNELQQMGYNIYIDYENDYYKIKTNIKIESGNVSNASNASNASNEVLKIEELIDFDYENEYVYDLTTENNHFAAGIGDLIVHNTDSIYVKFHTEFTGQEHMNEAFRLSQIAADGCTNLFKKPIEMEFEKMMDPFILFSKKRYACVTWTNPHKYDYIDYKGIQVVRRDNCPYVKDKSMNIFETILLEKNIEKSVSMARDFTNNLLWGKVPIKELVISKSLKGYGSYEFDKQVICSVCEKRWYVEENGKKVYKIPMNLEKSLEENIAKFISEKRYCHNCKQERYFETNKANIPHVALAREMKKRDPYNCPQVGERVPYVFKKVNKKNALQFERVEDPKYLQENCIPLDFEYYFEHQFKSALETIFAPILKDELNEKLFLGIIEEKPKRKKKNSTTE